MEWTYNLINIFVYEINNYDKSILFSDQTTFILMILFFLMFEYFIINIIDDELSLSSFLAMNSINLFLSILIGLGLQGLIFYILNYTKTILIITFIILIKIILYYLVKNHKKEVE